MTIDLLNVVEESFSTYAGMTIQNRALVDARDGLKPAARQCMYAQILDKITYKKPYKKAHKSVTAAMDHFYVHSDASCYELMTRLAKVFTMRYPLEDFKGNYGTISASGNEAAARYTEMRLGALEEADLKATLFSTVGGQVLDEITYSEEGIKQLCALMGSDIAPRKEFVMDRIDFSHYGDM